MPIKKKIKFISTPLDLTSANFLIKNCDIIKVASSDNNFFPMIDLLLKSNKKVIISTGLTNIDDLKFLSKRIYKILGKKVALRKIAFLHCVTSYPVPDKYANLSSIKFMKKKLDFSVGYSDHTLGIEACVSAASMGAKIIEKHFTIDKNFSNFRDHKLSANYNEMKEMIKRIRRIEILKGVEEKKIQACEKNFLNIVRRSPFANRALKIGEYLNIKNTKFLRSANSKNYLNLLNIFGRKTKVSYLKNNKIKKRFNRVWHKWLY